MPICDVTVGEAHDATRRSAIEAERATKVTRWSKELLQLMALQLRMLRRRGAYPTYFGIILFFLAYAVSLVMAFADVGERTTAHSLALGILISWFPVLVQFAILDRNPVSADRSR